ncbi:MAG: hypothetical protein II153_07050 [Erysipelotrichaceae bacterium]|nr:hypothetical protein [Erysipelotrichaceae bacterium]
MSDTGETTTDKKEPEQKLITAMDADDVRKLMNEAGQEVNETQAAEILENIRSAKEKEDTTPEKETYVPFKEAYVPPTTGIERRR